MQKIDLDSLVRISKFLGSGLIKIDLILSSLQDLTWQLFQNAKSIFFSLFHQNKNFEIFLERN